MRTHVEPRVTLSVVELRREGLSLGSADLELRVWAALRYSALNTNSQRSEVAPPLSKFDRSSSPGCGSIRGLP